MLEYEARMASLSFFRLRAYRFRLAVECVPGVCLGRCGLTISGLLKSRTRLPQNPRRGC